MSTVLFVLHAAILAAIAAALVVPGWRSRTAIALGAMAGIAVFAAALGDDPRSLDVAHRFAAIKGNTIEWTRFELETVTAGGLGWGLVAAAFLLGWAAVLWLTAPSTTELHTTAPRPPLGVGVDPFWVPLALAWSGIGLVLALEKTAAPVGLVDPLAMDRAILPASLAASALLALRCQRIVTPLMWLVVFVTAARAPIAGFGTLATDRRWGTSLDVHAMEHFANPFAATPIDVVAGSTEQLGWLLWAPNLLILPAIYMMSLGGIAFAITMFVLHPATEARDGAARPGGA